MMNNLTRRNIGMNFTDKGAEFTVWAPIADKIELIINDSEIFPCSRNERGYWSVSNSYIKHGDFYKIRINGEKLLPDPASLSQCGDVHGSSCAVDLNKYEWNDMHWKGLQEEPIFYELHTGTFTEKGNFEGIIDRIGYLKELGINTIEIMPVAQFPGERNWGYDGVFPFSVQSSYGGHTGLMRLIDECHRNGLAVVLDVVYNHLGPEGNYLEEFGPYFTDNYKTPWGKAINFDGPWSDGVRDFYLENMLMWFRDFHFDGLRLDAVHAIKDFGARHIIKQLREEADELENVTGRRYMLIGEIDLNDTRFINPYENGGYNLDMQWCDGFHHALHSFVTGERNGYYADFGELSHLVKSYNHAFVYDGLWSEHRKRTFGSSTAGINGNKFIVFTQNHDQIGNRALGERMGNLINFEMLKVVAGALFVSPFVPLIFMGEEYNETAPFLYFTSHSDKELAESVSKGRKKEFPGLIGSADFPEPQSEDVFSRSKLSFEMTGKRKNLFDFYRELIRLKKTHPVWKSYDRSGVRASKAGKEAIVVYKRFNENHLTSVMNFSKEVLVLSIPEANNSHVLINSSDVIYGGPGEGTILMNNDGMVTVMPYSIIVFSDKKS